MKFDPDKADALLAFCEDQFADEQAAFVHLCAAALALAPDNKAAIENFIHISAIIPKRTDQ